MGTMLYLVATPIGNLGDITLRAIEVLKSVDLIASEDTRKTGMLLKHFGIEKQQLPFHEHNEDRAGERIVEMLRYGKDVAVVTDAGTPGISDPGYSLVQLAIEAGVEVTMIPGAAAFVMAVVLSGLPVHSFTFKGFGPRKPGPRKRWMALDKESPHTLVYYESPYRLKAFLKDALEVYGDRHAALGHELTKMFESVERGTISELLEGLTDQKLRGEHVVVIAGLGRLSERAEAESDDEDD